VDVPSRISQRLTPAQRIALEERVRGLQALTAGWLADLTRDSMTPPHDAAARKTGCTEVDEKPVPEPRHSA
jgi:hypothetical protein